MKLAFVHIGVESLALEIFSSIIAKEFPQVEQKLFFHYDYYANPVEEKKSNKIRHQLVKKIKQYRPDICCFSAYTDSFNILGKIAKDIKMIFPETVNVFGGIHATLLKSELLEENKYIDIVAIGEAEATFKELMEEFIKGTQRWSKINGIVYRDGERVVSNPLRLALSPLDHIPFPNKDLFINHLPSVYLSYYVQTGRGCPHNCTYCASPYLKALYGSQAYFRRRSTQNIIDELELVKDQTKQIIFVDDVFLHSTEFLKEFLPIYHKKIGLPFFCQTSPALCNEERLDLLKMAGCHRIWLGIQSGSEMIRHNVFKRKGSNKDIVKATNLIRSKGIKFCVDIILGTPYETVDDIQKTLSLLCEIQPDLVQVFYLSYYPGLEITEMALRDGYLSEKEYKMIKSGIFQKSYSVGSHLTGKALKDARRTGLMCHLLTILPKRLSSFLIKKRLYSIFPSGFIWHLISYALTALHDRVRLYLIWGAIQAKIKKTLCSSQG